jgi:hypothetical protein
MEVAHGSLRRLTDCADLVSRCVFEAGSNVAAVEALVAERFLLLEGADADELSDLFDDAPCVGDIEAVPGVGELA